MFSTCNQTGPSIHVRNNCLTCQLSGEKGKRRYRDEDEEEEDEDGGKKGTRTRNAA